jgi:hypothetical protein
VKIHGATDHLREFILESGESEARNMAGFEFDENIDVAVRSKIGPQYRAKEGYRRMWFRSQNAASA